MTVIEAQETFNRKYVYTLPSKKEAFIDGIDPQEVFLWFCAVSKSLTNEKVPKENRS